MDAETLSLTAGALLALGCAYLPGLAPWFAKLGETRDENGQVSGDGGTRKRLLMLALLCLAAGGAFAISCAELRAPGFSLTCDKAGAWGLVRALILAVTANQAAYQISPRTGRARGAGSQAGR